MRSLKGFVLKHCVNGENGGSADQKEMHHPGNSMKIGSSFVCHIVLKELKDVHFAISLNEYNQVGDALETSRRRSN